MDDLKNPLKTPPLSDRPSRRSRIQTLFGKWGPVWAVAFTTVASLLRWATDGILADHAPFSFYYLSVVLTALVAPMGSSILAVILGGACGHYIWVQPRLSLEFLDNGQRAQLVVYIFVATPCALAVTAARLLRLFDYMDAPDD